MTRPGDSAGRIVLWPSDKRRPVLGHGDCAGRILSRSVNTADLVTIRVQKVAQVHEAHVALARSRWIFRGSAAVRYRYVVEFL